MDRKNRSATCTYSSTHFVKETAHFTHLCCCFFFHPANLLFSPPSRFCLTLLFQLVIFVYCLCDTTILCVSTSVLVFVYFCLVFFLIGYNSFYKAYANAYFIYIFNTKYIHHSNEMYARGLQSYRQENFQNFAIINK